SRVPHLMRGAASSSRLSVPAFRGSFFRSWFFPPLVRASWCPARIKPIERRTWVLALTLPQAREGVAARRRLTAISRGSRRHRRSCEHDFLLLGGVRLRTCLI